ncbi:MAG: hypothetical protein HUU35_20255 [Armatimonadetes bacterium]|nr:hypothetical protein [Armatimonadota bacterium]
MKAEASRLWLLGTALVPLLSFSPAYGGDQHLHADTSKAATTDNQTTTTDQTRGVNTTTTNNACGLDTSRGVPKTEADKPTSEAEQRHDSTLNDVSGGTAKAPANELNNEAADASRAAAEDPMHHPDPALEMGHDPYYYGMDGYYYPEYDRWAELEMGRYYDAEADLYAPNELDGTRGIEAESTAGSCGVVTTDSDATRGVTSDTPSDSAPAAGSCGVTTSDSSTSGVAADTSRAATDGAFAGTKIVCVPNEQLGSRGADTVTMDGGAVADSATMPASETVLMLNGVRILQFRVPAGDYSPSERWEIVQHRLQQALVADARHRVAVSDLNGSPAIYLGSHLLLTVTEADARANGTTPAKLASRWAANLREAISSISR